MQFLEVQWLDEYWLFHLLGEHSLSKFGKDLRLRWSMFLVCFGLVGWDRACLDRACLGVLGLCYGVKEWLMET